MKHFFDWFLAIAAVSGNRSHIPAAVITLALLTPAVVLADPMLGTGVIHDPSESPTDGWKGSYVYYGTYDSRQVK